ncbi:MAG: zf-HC2 domain-containing protein [Endomicrobiales bacterium]|jgi:anti-sigma factor RsiW
MNCHNLRVEIVPYYQDELSSEDRAQFETHVQLCPSCARLSHEMSLTMEFSRRTLERKYVGDIYPRVEAILSKSPSVLIRFRWAVIPALTAMLVASMITPTVIRPLPELHPEALTLAQDLEMFLDYDVLENLDVLDTGSVNDKETAPL